MALSEHYMFNQVGVVQSLLWRYMTLAKFLSFVQSQSLFFSSLQGMTKLDPFEGSIPPSYVEYRDWRSEADIPSRAFSKYEEHLRARNGNEKEAFLSFIQGRENWLKACYANRRASYISCWHLNDCESDAMWNIYAPAGEGVAVVTTLERLNSSLDTSKHLVRGGLVKYVDFDTVVVNESKPNMYEPALLKRNSFSHEKEFRLVHIDNEINLLACKPSTVNEAFKKPYSTGVNIPVELNRFIEKIVVAPTAPKWLYEVIEKYCSENGMQTDISALVADPVTYVPVA